MGGGAGPAHLGVEVDLGVEILPQSRSDASPYQGEVPLGCVGLEAEAAAPLAQAGIKVLAAQVDGADAKALRDAVDQLRSRLGSSIIVLATVKEGKAVLVAGVSVDLLERFKAGEIVGAVAAQVGGRGGGRADFAQAGGTQPENLAMALASVETLVRGQLSN